MHVNYKSYLPLLIIIIFRVHYGWNRKDNEPWSISYTVSQIQYKMSEIAHTDPWIYQRWDQVPRRNRHPLLTGHTHREPLPVIKVGLHIEFGKLLICHCFCYRGIQRWGGGLNLFQYLLDISTPLIDIKRRLKMTVDPNFTVVHDYC